MMYGGSIAGGSSSCRRVGGNVSWIEELLGRMADDSRRRCALGGGRRVPASGPTYLASNVAVSEYQAKRSLSMVLHSTTTAASDHGHAAQCMQYLKRVRCG